MPNYTVNDGRRAIIDGKLCEAGDKVTLDTDQGDALVSSGVLTPVKRGRPPSKRSGWTNTDDDSDDSDD